eukprot:1079707-Amphidinium_carterae.2
MLQPKAHIVNNVVANRDDHQMTRSHSILLAEVQPHGDPRGARAVPCCWHLSNKWWVALSLLSPNSCQCVPHVSLLPDSKLVALGVVESARAVAAGKVKPARGAWVAHFQRCWFKCATCEWCAHNGRMIGYTSGRR